MTAAPADITLATCPFCSLLCDDLSLSTRPDQSFSIVRNGCRRAEKLFRRRPVAPQPLIAGQPVNLETAVARAARILRRARHPLIAGLATDVEGARASVNLAERCGGALDHVNGDALMSMSRLLQTRGWYSTTLSEVRNRADLVLLIDVDFQARHENFIRRCLTPDARPEAASGTTRTIVHLGARSAKRFLPTGTHVLPCHPSRLTEALLALNARLRGHPLKTRDCGLKAADLERLVELVRAAQYTALVFAPGSLGGEREPLSSAICDLVESLNREARAALLSLGGDEGGMSAVSACAWLTGFPLRVQMGRTISFEPQRINAAKLIATGQADAVLWVDAFGNQPSPPVGIPPDATVILGAAHPSDIEQCGVYIPVGTPGLDHPGRLVRTDSVVTLALTGQRDTGLSSVAGVLTRILDRL